MTERRVDCEHWPAASKKRQLLAVYLDYLLFGAPWTVVVSSLSESIPALEKLAFPLQILLFLALESLLFGVVRWSPGIALLGMRTTVGPTIAPSGEERKTRYVVDPWLKLNERWWTVLFGVLVVLDGAKVLTRWTKWTPAMPFMGIQLDETATAVVCLALGMLECAVGCVALRLHRALMLLGPLLYASTLASVVLSWPLWPDWIERYVVARRAYQGLPVRDGEVEIMRLVIPVGMVAIGVIMWVWMGLVALRCHRARTSLEPASS